MPDQDTKNNTPRPPQAAETNCESKIDFLRERLHYHIDEYKEKRNQRRKRANVYRFGAIVLGAIITLLLAVKTSVNAKWPGADEILSTIALLFSTIVTAMGSWETFSDYRGKWIRSRSTLVTLYNIRDDLRYALAGNEELPNTEFDKFYERLRLALSETNEDWVSRRGNAIAGAASSGKSA